MSASQQQQISEINSLCERYGFPIVAGEAMARWFRKQPDIAFRMGPPAGFTTECEHWGYAHSTECGWCAGAGWVTHKVAKIVLESLNV